MKRTGNRGGTPGYALGIDLGGTKTGFAVLDGEGCFLTRERIATPASDYHAICAAIAAGVAEVEARHGCIPVGIGMPGAISPVTGLVRNANTTCLNGRPFAADLARLLGREPAIANDANCLALSEARGGSAASAATAFHVIIGTGTGGGLTVAGRLLVGANAIAGEWGHNRVPWDVAGPARRACYCGRLDCVETYLCGAGLARTYAALAGLDEATPVPQIVARAAAGDGTAGAALDVYAEQLASCLAQVVNVFDPDVIVLAGGLSNLPDLPAKVLQCLPSRVFSDTVQTRVSRAYFGDSSGVRGAALLCTNAVGQGHAG